MLIPAAAVALCTAWTLAGLGAVVATRGRRSPPLGGPAPAVTVLKPLCGADAELEANLRSFFLQDYPDYELVFGVEDEADPAVAVVRRLREAHPEVRCTLVVHSGSPGTNPKVRNLLKMAEFASSDLLLVSDSNVRAPAHYVQEMVATLREESNTGLVTSLVVGSGENGLGSALDNVQLNGFCTPGAALPTLVGQASVIGKSMLFSRRVLERLGGLDRVADVLAEDYVLGKMFQHGGYQVRLAPTVVQNVTRDLTLRAFLRRHQRWAMLRTRLVPVSYALEFLTSPLAVLPFAYALVGAPALLWAVGLLVLRDVGGWVALRGVRRAWLPVFLSPVRELLMLVVWAHAPLKRHVSWRGHRVRLGAGTLLYREGRTPANDTELRAA